MYLSGTPMRRATRLIAAGLGLVLLSACGSSAPPAPTAAPTAAAKPAEAAKPAASPAAPAPAAASSPAPATSPAASPAASPSAAAKPAASPAASASPAAASAAPKPSGPATKVIFGMSAASITGFPIDVAIDRGYFAQHGIEVEVQTLAPAVAVQALGSGQIDFTNFTGSSTRAAIQGLPVKILALLQTEPYSFMVNKDVKSFADLKGKSVGVDSIGSDQTLYIQAIAEKNGMKLDDVAQIALQSIAAEESALVSGQIPAVVTTPPFSQRLKAQGFVALYGPEAANLPSNGLAVSQKMFERKEVVQQVVSAMVDAIAWTRNNPNEAAPYFAQKYSIDQSLARDAYQQQMDALRFNFSDQDLQAVITHTLEATNQRDKQVPLAQVFDVSAYRAAVAAAGLK